MQISQKKFHVKKNDIVFVMTGKDKGKKGKILSILREKNKFVVEGINFVKRHIKPTQKDPKGGIIQKESPIHVSNLMLICNKCNRPVRIRHKKIEDKNVRVCIKCDEVI
ncbi:MAG: 50S ribosomal protein L24 [bacterium]